MSQRDEQLARIRRTRNARLAACDWTQLQDAPISAAKVQAWRSYRQLLRDLPATANAEGAVEWPARPA